MYNIREVSIIEKVICTTYFRLLLVRKIGMHKYFVIFFLLKTMKPLFKLAIVQAETITVDTVEERKRVNGPMDQYSKYSVTGGE